MADGEKWWKPRMMTREEMGQNRWLAPIAHRFLSPELWRFTRRSVPRGVALGLFAGFIVPVGQIFLAAFLALPVRANVPVAAAATFLTNPFTLPFFLVLANRLGHWVLFLDQATGGQAPERLDGDAWAFMGWFVEVAGATALGYLILAIVGAIIGYAVAALVWRLVVARKWSRRALRRERRHSGPVAP
ncbi:DUF2062 domain-containing protein [Croceibacterium ferulae]|uniref:DUF2062 domain-containing protein n=1 Tax=Croceibacterium ferulae TaxID=1854641 RepID=UPI001F4E1862|nr:DUF2062 domain-containing protein [Croceibacterium ferulae]